jgi:type VI secretion system protein ImpB
MARESSIAPKERINVTFKPATGGAQEEIELPLKVMVMGDFFHRYDDRPFIDRKPVAVNKNNFADVMGKLDLNLQISVPNRLSDSVEDTELTANLAFKNTQDFEPEGIACQVPAMRKLLDLREALVSLKGPLGNIPAFRKAIQEVLNDERQRDQVIKELGLSEADIVGLAEDIDHVGGQIRPASGKAADHIASSEDDGNTDSKDRPENGKKTGEPKKPVK